MSVNELDAELLAMAGDESSGDESATPRDKSHLKSSSPPKTAEIALNQTKRSTTKHRIDKKSKSARRSRRSDSGEGGEEAEEEEEGEAASASSVSGSVGSDAMSESGVDATGDSAIEEEALFPFEGKYYSQKDKDEILSMSEIQREAILAERAQQIERRTQDLHLRQLLKDREKDEAKAESRTKRNAANAGLDDTPRKSSRPKTTKKSETLEMYNKERKERGKQRQRIENDMKNRGPSTNGTLDKSDNEADDDSGVEWDTGAPKSVTAAPEDPAAAQRDYERVRVGRTNFAKVCFYPGFEDAITGCFCRVSIGMDRSTGQNMYRVAQIKGGREIMCLLDIALLTVVGFMEGKPYTMEGQNGMNFMTDQYAIVAHGKAVKEWPFVACSDSKFTEAEYEKYQRTLKTDSLKSPTRKQLIEKLDCIHKLLNRSWTEEDISYKLNRQNKYAADAIRTSATSAQNAAAIARSSSKGPSQADRLAALNKANRKANADEVRKAQIAVKKAEAVARAAAAAKHAKLEVEAAEAEAAGAGKGTDNTLTANNLLGVPGTSVAKASAKSISSAGNLDDLFDGSNTSRGGTPGTMTPKMNPISRSSTPMNGQQQTKINGAEKKGGSGLSTSFRKRNMDDDLIASLDLGIEIDI